jgi:glucosyl-dolichyl phosphate glucuronosyltransferase
MFAKYVVGMDRAVKLSVIVPTRNRVDRLKRFLDSLKRQTLSVNSFEVIVVDNGSSDHTKSVVQSFAPSLPLSYSFKEEPGLHVGRHEGMRLAQTGILVYADDDVEAEPTWLEAINDSFDDPAVTLVGGNVFPAFEESPPAWLKCLWERHVYKGQALGALSVLDFGKGRFEIDPGYVWGCNYSIRRDILLRAGGFHPDGMPPEKLRYRGNGETHVSNYIRASGLKSVFDSHASVHHLVTKDRMTEDYFCKRYFAQGISDSYANIRAAGGIQDSRKDFVNLARSVRWNFRLLTEAVRWPNDPIRMQMVRVLRSAQRRYWDGYRFHTQAVAEDQELLEWVSKEDYF